MQCEDDTQRCQAPTWCSHGWSWPLLRLWMGIKTEAQASISLRGQTMGSHGHLTSWQMPKQVHCPSAGRECYTSTGTWNNVLIPGVWQSSPFSTIAWHQKPRNQKKKTRNPPSCLRCYYMGQCYDTDWLLTIKTKAVCLWRNCSVLLLLLTVGNITHSKNMAIKSQKIFHNSLNGPNKGICLWGANFANKKTLAGTKKYVLSLKL